MTTTEAAAQTGATDRAPDEGVDGPGPAQEPGAPPAGGGVTRRRGWVVALAALLVLLVAGTVLAAVLSARAQAREDDRAAATDVASTAARALIGLDFENGRQNLDQLAGIATGGFRDQVTGLSNVIDTVLQEGRITSTGTVRDVGIEGTDGRQAVVLLAVDATVRNTQLPEGQPRTYRMAVTLQKADDQWLVSAVDFP